MKYTLQYFTIIWQKIDSAIRPAMFPGFQILGLTLVMIWAQGCASQADDPTRARRVGIVGQTTLTPLSALMLRTNAPNMTPPAGKSMVVIHRPKKAGDYHSGIWDGTNFIADLWDGQAAAYVCEPGQHYFINRSPERIGVVEADLLPNRTYGLWVEWHMGWVTVEYQLEPIKRDSKVRKQLPMWTEKHLWVTKGPPVADHEKQRQPEIALILRDFQNGKKKDRLRILAPEDHF